MNDTNRTGKAQGSANQGSANQGSATVPSVALVDLIPVASYHLIP